MSNPRPFKGFLKICFKSQIYEVLKEKIEIDAVLQN